PPMNALYPDLTISSQLQAVIMRALEKDPRVRYQSMLEFAQAISGTPDAAALGYRPTITSIAEHSISSLPHSPGSPTAQQFAPAAQDPRPEPSRAAEALAKQSADPARAETQLSAETIAVSPSARSRSGLAVAVLAAAVLAGGAGLFFAKRGSSTTPTPEVNAPLVPKAALAPASVVGVPATNSQPAPSAESAKPAEVTAVAPASAIRLDVSSDPTGATLSKNGFQVCDATPCEVLATPNETLEFEAAKGALKGSAKVLAQRDQKVTIKLAATAAPAKHADTSATPRMCEVEVDGLKILRPCK
ncbi:MAG TPA: hypothetical protein VNW92_18575, partial [Polyangiaceae bacterium]|nr:hypothetical protein [Polyangiaceae bacterium]